MFDGNIWFENQFTYGGVRYRILPMSKLDAMKVFELVRTNLSLHADLPLGTLLPFITGGPPEALIESSLIMGSEISTSVMNELREIAWNHLQFESEGEWALMSDDAVEVVIDDHLPAAASIYWLMARTLIHHQVGDISDMRAALFPPAPRIAE